MMSQIIAGGYRKEARDKWYDGCVITKLRFYANGDPTDFVRYSGTINGRTNVVLFEGSEAYVDEVALKARADKEYKRIEREKQRGYAGHGLRLRSNLGAILEAQDLTIREVGRRIDYRFEAVRKFARDEVDGTRIPSELLLRLCAEFNCDVADILTVEPAHVKTKEAYANGSDGR